ncbi:MAG: hypothetical protein ABSA31_03350 [Acidimicrobiales bacterium]|jgi:cbb3-type cytochrome oxidase subunit 3
MGFLDALLGRTKPAQANLDKLFGLPGAQITLEASEGLQPTGQAGVCFKPTEGQAFSATESEFTALLNLGDDAGGHVAESSDQYGYRWVVLEADDFGTLVTRVHVTNSTLQDNGYGPQLLCSVFGFAPAPQAGAARAAATVYLVYLYKRGTFYPFVPAGGERRDNEAELRLKNELGDDLSIESDLTRWFPIWGLPVH